MLANFCSAIAAQQDHGAWESSYRPGVVRPGLLVLTCLEHRARFQMERSVQDVFGCSTRLEEEGKPGFCHSPCVGVLVSVGACRNLSTCAWRRKLRVGLGSSNPACRRVH